MIFSSTVPHSSARKPIEAYLAARFTYHSLDEWKAFIRNEKILRNGEPCTVSQEIEGGDLISFIAPEYREPPADCSYTVLFEDDWLCVVAKPGNLLVHRSGKSFHNNLLSLLQRRRPEDFHDAHVVNRPDRETSGVVIVAKSAVVKRAFDDMTAKRTIRKRYEAIVHGIPSQRRIDIVAPIGKDTDSAISYKFRVDPKNGKKAGTVLELIRTCGPNASLVNAYPRQGRTHQIRVHCASIGHYVLGDKLYALSEKEYLDWRNDPQNLPPTLPIARQALHCASISCIHPCTGKEIEFCAPLPQDMLILLKKCESSNGGTTGSGSPNR